MAAGAAADSSGAPVQLTAASATAAAPSVELRHGETEALPEGKLQATRDAPLGGQAVMEGVMMRGVSNWAVAVRKPTAEQLAEGERPPEEAALGAVSYTHLTLPTILRV